LIQEENNEAKKTTEIKEQSKEEKKQ